MNNQGCNTDFGFPGSVLDMAEQPVVFLQFMIIGQDWPSCDLFYCPKPRRQVIVKIDFEERSADGEVTSGEVWRFALSAEQSEIFKSRIFPKTIFF